MTFIVVLYFFAGRLGQQTTLDRLFLWGSSLLLLQGLIRDVYILYFSSNQVSQSHAGDKVKSNCMCIESTLGVLGIVIGSMLVFVNVQMTILMSNFTWWLLLSAVMVVGFLIKDYVLQWNPWGIREEKNHINLIFTFKK